MRVAVMVPFAQTKVVEVGAIDQPYEVPAPTLVRPSLLRKLFFTAPIKTRRYAFSGAYATLDQTGERLPLFTLDGDPVPSEAIAGRLA